MPIILWLRLIRHSGTARSNTQDGKSPMSLFELVTRYGGTLLDPLWKVIHYISRSAGMPV